MVVKYEWRCDRRDGETPKWVRTEIRLPEALHAVLTESARTHGVSLNEFLNGLLVWAADSEGHKRLVVDVAPTKVKIKEVVPGRAIL